CGMCTLAVNRIARLDRTGRLRIEPWQSQEVADRIGVPDDRLTESAWWLDSSGAVFAGAHAMNAALSAALGTRLPFGSTGSPGSARCKTSSTAGWRHTDIAFAVSHRSARPNPSGARSRKPGRASPAPNCHSRRLASPHGEDTRVPPRVRVRSP